MKPRRSTARAPLGRATRFLVAPALALMNRLNSVHFVKEAMASFTALTGEYRLLLNELEHDPRFAPHVARVRAGVFDPFFTTKDVGRGTGQGLAVARAIVVDRHGGTLGFETEPGFGTTFFIRLPIAGSGEGLVAA